MYYSVVQFGNKYLSIYLSAARLVTGTAKYAHITQDLIKLHWLPVKQRIVYKIIVVVYKALHGIYF